MGQSGAPAADPVFPYHSISRSPCRHPPAAHPQSLLPIHNDTSARLHLNTHATSRGAQQQQRTLLHMNANGRMGEWAPILIHWPRPFQHLQPPPSAVLLWECQHLNRIASSATGASTSNGSLNFRFSRSAPSHSPPEGPFTCVMGVSHPQAELPSTLIMTKVLIAPHMLHGAWVCAQNYAGTVDEIQQHSATKIYKKKLSLLGI